MDACVGNIDENGNTWVKISESDYDTSQAFAIRMNKKKLRKLKDFAAYNVAQYPSCDSDGEDWQVPISQVKTFVKIISGDYIFDLNEN